MIYIQYTADNHFLSSSQLIKGQERETTTRRKKKQRANQATSSQQHNLNYVSSI